MSEPNEGATAAEAVEAAPKAPMEEMPTSSKIPTPASSVTGIPTASKLKAPTNFAGSTGSIDRSKIGRLCSHAAPKAGLPPRDPNSMSRESDDTLSSINSAYTDLYQETVRRFTRSSLSPELERSSTKSPTASTSHKSHDFYLEATGRRRSSDHGAVLTADTEQFIIGQHVWVGGIRPGQIAYIGETHFAPGEWAGVVLDEPNGKNDGCVAGKRYFQCEPKRGIFSRLTRLTFTPLPGAYVSSSPQSKNSPERSRTVSPTASIRSSFLRSPGKNGLTVGDRVIVSSGFGSRPGILRYLGETQFASGNWCGVELDEATGKNDGSVDGIRYFECKPKYGVFVPIAKVSLSPSSKKSRLSRTGSRESLTSIGTMNSIATTNTSRLRANAQRKSSLIKPITTPKSQFSLQDLLREKQHYIEQLMVERDLDREDTHNTALQFQKNISELKARIAHLERLLEDERKKTEDLQFSIDEATYCGDEQSAQSQVYKDRIRELESQLTQLKTDAQKTATSSGQEAGVAAAASQALIDELNARLSIQATAHQAELATTQDEEKRLQEQIKYLKIENEQLQKELLDKDANLEKLSLSECGMDHLQSELALLKQEAERERQQAHECFAQKLGEKDSEVELLKQQLSLVNSTLATLQSEHTNKEDECEILRAECQTRNEQASAITAQLQQLSAELELQRQQCAALQDQLSAHQQSSATEKSTLAAHIADLGKLQREKELLLEGKTALEANLEAAQAEVRRLGELQKGFEQKLQIATDAEGEHAAAIEQLRVQMAELQKQAETAEAEKATMATQLEAVRAAASHAEQQLRSEASEQAALCAAKAKELDEAQKASIELQAQLSGLRTRSEQELAAQTKHIEGLQAQLQQLQAERGALVGEGATKAQAAAARIQSLEAQVAQLEQQLAGQVSQGEQRQAELERQTRLLTERGAELGKTQLALESTNGLLDKLRQEYEHATDRCRELDDRLRLRDEQQAQQQLELGDLARKFEAASSKCDHVAQQNELLQADILSARKSAAELQAEVRQLNEELAAKQRALLELQSEGQEERAKQTTDMAELQQRLTSAEKDGAELKSELERVRGEVASRLEQIASLEEKGIKLELALSEAQRQQEHMKSKCEALAQHNQTLQQDLMTLRTTSTDTNGEIVKLSQALAAQQKSYEELVDKSNGEQSALATQLEARQQQVDTLCGQVETLTQELKASSETSFGQAEQLRHAQEKCTRLQLELDEVQRKLHGMTAKCEQLEQQNAALQKDLSAQRSTADGSNAELLKLTEELSLKQRQLQGLTDEASAERLQFEKQLHEQAQRLESAQSELERVRAELKLTTEAKEAQAANFEQQHADRQAKQLEEAQQWEEMKARHATEQAQLRESFERQLKGAEQAKSNLDDGIRSLQQQIQLLQDELLKSQIDFKAKEEDFAQRVTALQAHNHGLQLQLEAAQSSNSSDRNELLAQQAALQQTVAQLKTLVERKDNDLQVAHAELEQLKQAAEDAKTKLAQHQAELEKALALSREENERMSKVGEEERRRIGELQVQLQSLQEANAQSAQANAQMAEALQILEDEKCETAHIFELFEMESDQNAEKLIAKMSSVMHELSEAQTQLVAKEGALKALNEANEALTHELQQIKSEQAELAAQLSEYKSVIDEMDESAVSKSTDLTELQQRLEAAEQSKQSALRRKEELKADVAHLKRQLESMDLEKTREIVSLQSRLNQMQSAKVATIDPTIQHENGDSTAQINFLNSIIADMQKKNDTLKAKIEALEAIPADFTKPEAFEIFAKRKPAPRLFCDICDEFDKHETEDCPLQCSDARDSPTLGLLAKPGDAAKERKLPEPRKYCETCEVFGHETGECPDEFY